MNHQAEVSGKPRHCLEGMPHKQTKSEEDKQSMALPSPDPSGTCTLSVRAISTEDRTTCTTFQRQSNTILQVLESKVPNEVWRNMEESNGASD